jgi:alpha-tubulin suppressor-like RCC1 family protein
LSLAATAAASSDIRLKTNIKLLGKENGHNVYSWDWNEDGKRIADPKQPTVGVMAQELQETHPHLVELGPDGFLRVDYSGLAAEAA